MRGGFFNRFRLFLLSPKVTDTLKQQLDSQDLRFLRFLDDRLNGNPINLKARANIAIDNVTSFAKKTGEFLQDNSKKIDVEQVMGVKEKLIGFMKIYNSSLENLVEGQREVLKNEDFVFEDGETAKEKEAKFVNKLRQMTKEQVGKHW